MRISKRIKIEWRLTVWLILIVSILSVSCGGSPNPTSTKPPTMPPPSTGFTVVIAKPVPHPIANFENCIKCHSLGENATPASHAGFTNETCLSCHRPGFTTLRLRQSNRQRYFLPAEIM